MVGIIDKDIPQFWNGLAPDSIPPCPVFRAHAMPDEIKSNQLPSQCYTKELLDPLNLEKKAKVFVKRQAGKRTW